MLAAFEAAVVLKSPQRLHLVLCLAENAIGPKAMRNDDILKLLSGKTVTMRLHDALLNKYSRLDVSAWRPPRCLTSRAISLLQIVLPFTVTSLLIHARQFLPQLH